MNESGDEGTARIARLRDEIERVIEREYAFAVKYRALAASFEAFMTDPNRRHDAVLLALSTTMKREVREIGAAVAGQQEELALLEQAVGELFSRLGAKGGGQGSQAPDTSNAGPVDDIIPGTVALAGTWTYQKPAAKTRACPVCRKKMDWSEQEKRWKCFFCGHKTK